MELTTQLNIEQSLTLSLNQVQSLNILAMDNYELEKFLQIEYAENPLMEHTPSSEPSYATYNRGVIHESRENVRPEIKAASSNDVKDFLMEQLNPSLYSNEEWKLMEDLIQCLDTHGHFHMTLEEFSTQTGYPLKKCEDCYGILSKLEPIGIFSHSMEEAMIAQLKHNGDFDEHIEQIILHHLEQLANGELCKITRALGISSTQVRKYKDLIQKLRPNMLYGLSNTETEYVVPDVILSLDADQNWKITLNDQWIGNYALNDYYASMLRRSSDPELREYFQKKYDRCILILNSIEKRRETLIHICESILKRQEAYFLHKGPLVSMTMKEIADEIDVHTSTISRGIKKKYIQYPFGTCAFKSLFTTASSSKGDTTATKDTLSIEIKQIIDSENPAKPYSDQQIVTLLEEKDYHISRRTVAKYRKQLGIGGVFDRKITE